MSPEDGSPEMSDAAETVAAILAGQQDWNSDTLDVIAEALTAANLLELCSRCGYAKRVNVPCVHTDELGHDPYRARVDGALIGQEYGRFDLPSDDCIPVQRDDERPDVFADDMSAAVAVAAEVSERTGATWGVGYHSPAGRSVETIAMGGDVWVSPNESDRGAHPVNDDDE